MEKNIKWPAKSKLHWRTKKLIRNFPILKSSNVRDAYYQEVILESELDYIKWIEESESFSYQLRAYTKYRKDLTNALHQLQYIENKYW
jgi:hypothetical protein